MPKTKTASKTSPKNSTKTSTTHSTKASTTNSKLKPTSTNSRLKPTSTNSKKKPTSIYGSLSSYQSIAACKEVSISQPFEFTYEPKDPENFEQARTAIALLIAENNFVRYLRWKNPLTDAVYGSQAYKDILAWAQQQRRDHLEPDAYFNDYSSDPKTLARKKRYYVTSKKFQAFIQGCKLKDESILPTFSDDDVIRFGQSLFADFEEKGLDVEAYVEDITKRAFQAQDAQRILIMANNYFVRYYVPAQQAQAFIYKEQPDAEFLAYAAWMCDLLESRQLLGESEQRYFHEPDIPSQGWDKFKQAGHKVIFALRPIYIHSYSVSVLIAYSTETQAVLHYVLIPEGGKVQNYFELLASKLKLTDFSFCGFYAYSQAFTTEELEYFNQRRIEYYILLPPAALLRQKQLLEWVWTLSEPVYTQIRPQVFNDILLTTAQALTKEEYAKGSYQVNPDLNWLSKPLTEVTLADARPDLAKAEKPFCYLVVNHPPENQQLEQAWAQQKSKVANVCSDLSFADLGQELNVSFKGNKVELDPQVFCFMHRVVGITNVGSGSFLVEDQYREDFSALLGFAGLQTHFWAWKVNKIYQFDDYSFWEFAKSKGFAEITYESAKSIFPEFFHKHLLENGYYGPLA